MLVGADVAQLRALAQALGRDAESLEQARVLLSGLVAGPVWVGPSGQAFRARWQGQLAPSMVAAVAGLREASRAALRNAEEQERASAADSSGGPAGGLGGGLGGSAGASLMGNPLGGSVSDGAGMVPDGGAGATLMSNPGAGGGWSGPVSESASAAEEGLARVQRMHMFRSPDQHPVAVRAWWDGLTPEQQEHMLTNRPEVVGRLDGLPSPVRDEANRVQLDHEIARLDAQIAAGHMNVLGIELPRSGKVARLLEDRADLVELERTLDKNPSSLLLDLRTDDAPIRAAVSLGNPDAADYVSVHVAGTGSDVNTIAGDLGRAKSILEQSQDLLRREDSDGVVASVVWAGYDAPDDIPTEAIFRRFATAGAPDFASFADGLRVAVGDEARMTASGHSYGSTVVGLGLQRTEAFDAFVASGSPGLGTDGTLEVRIPEGQTYVSFYDMPGDVVAWSGSHGQRPQDLPGVVVTDNSPRTVQFADGSSASYSGGGSTVLWQHSDYWDDGRSALFNQAAITVGRDDLVAAR